MSSVVPGMLKGMMIPRNIRIKSVTALFGPGVQYIYDFDVIRVVYPYMYQPTITMDLTHVTNYNTYYAWSRDKVHS